MIKLSFIILVNLITQAEKSATSRTSYHFQPLIANFQSLVFPFHANNQVHIVLIFQAYRLSWIKRNAQPDEFSFQLRISSQKASLNQKKFVTFCAVFRKRTTRINKK